MAIDDFQAQGAALKARGADRDATLVDGAAELVRLRTELEAIKRLLRRQQPNSTSAGFQDPEGIGRPQPPRSGQKRGGHTGHALHSRAPVPAEDVKKSFPSPSMVLAAPGAAMCSVCAARSRRWEGRRQKRRRAWHPRPFDFGCGAGGTGSSRLAEAPAQRPNLLVPTLRGAPMTAHSRLASTLLLLAAALSCGGPGTVSVELPSTRHQAATLAAGSLIIPLDNAFQPTAILRAYGLVHRLVEGGVPVQ